MAICGPVLPARIFSGDDAHMKFTLLLPLLLLYPLTAVSGVKESNKYAWLGFTALNFDYEEFDDLGISLDREDGVLPGISLGLGAESGSWFAEAGFIWHSGSVDYYSPSVTSKTDEDILDIGLSTGVWIFNSESLRAGFLAGVGSREWQRNIRSTATASGLDETYRWGYGTLGLRWQQAIGEKTKIVADIQLTRTINPEIDVHFKSGFDDIELDLGEANGHRFYITLLKQLGDKASLMIYPWYEYWELGRSADTTLFANGIPSGTVFEPRSETRNYGLTIGVRWMFGGK